MTSIDPGPHEESRIRSMVDRWTLAVCAGDLDTRVADYAADVRVFDVVNPLQQSGVSAVRERLESWLASFEGSIGYSTHDLDVVASGGVGYAVCLNHIRGTLRSGDEIDMWVRTTACLRVSDGRWLVVHEHTSAPFDPETGRASVDLQP